MSAFDNPNQELESLKKQLLQDEEWFEKELDSARRMLGENVPVRKAVAAPAPTAVRKAPPAPQAPVRPAPKAPPMEKEYPKTKGIRGLVILAVLETLGIVGVVAYWLLVLLK